MLMNRVRVKSNVVVVTSGHIGIPTLGSSCVQCSAMKCNAVHMVRYRQMRLGKNFTRPSREGQDGCR